MAALFALTFGLGLGIYYFTQKPGWGDWWFWFCCIVELALIILGCLLNNTPKPHP